MSVISSLRKVTPWFTNTCSIALPVLSPVSTSSSSSLSPSVVASSWASAEKECKKGIFQYNFFITMKLHLECNIDKWVRQWGSGKGKNDLYRNVTYLKRKLVSFWTAMNIEMVANMSHCNHGGFEQTFLARKFTYEKKNNNGTSKVMPMRTFKNPNY